MRPCCLNCRRFKINGGCQSKRGARYGVDIFMPGRTIKCRAFKATRRAFVQ